MGGRGGGGAEASRACGPCVYLNTAYVGKPTWGIERVLHIRMTENT